MNPQSIPIPCTDNFKLAATLYQPQKATAAIMICPATGIKRGFYHAFASHLAENGYGVITYDNRGIGDSVKGNINKVDATLVNWGRLDMTAVLEELKRRFPGLKYHLVGHSAGGQLVGLMENAMELSSIFNFACSSGSLRNMKQPFRRKAKFFMNFFIPASNLVFGKTQSQWVGMGEPLPKKVAAQWSRWCNGEGYIQVDLGKSIKNHVYDKLSLPSRWLYATDDDIANLTNVKDMVRVYSKMHPEIIKLDPVQYPFNDIGHMKFFSSRRSELWKYAIDWFEAH